RVHSMSLSVAEVWTRLLDRARQEMPEQTFRIWLEPTEPLALEGDTIVIGAPDQFAADWNESKHADLLSNYGPVALGHPIRVAFRVHEERRTRQQMDLFVATPAATVEPGARRENGADPAAPLNARYTFDHFVVGKSNELAYAAAHGVAQAPGSNYNPLLIYGH